MNCPRCHSKKTHIVDSRPLETGTSRRRECDACQHRFTTIEAMAIGPDEAGELAQKIESKIEELMILLAQAGEVAAYLRKGRQPGPTVNTASAAKKDRGPRPAGKRQAIKEGKKRAKVVTKEAIQESLKRVRAEIERQKNGNEGEQ